jgi:MFS family permease
MKILFNKRLVGIIIAGILTVFIAYGIRYAYGILLPHMLPDLQITKTEAGIIFASYFMVYLICAPVLGFIADRYDLRVILTLSTLMLGLGAFLMSIASTVLNSSLFFSVAAVGHSACWAPVTVLFQRWIVEKHKGTALAIADTGSALGIMSCGVGLPIIVNGFGWRAGWMSLAFFSVIVAAINYLFIRSHPEGYVLNNRKENKNTGIRQIYPMLFRDPKLWFIGMSYLLGGGICVNILFTFLTSYAIQELMISYKVSAGYISVASITAVLSKFVFGPLSDRLGRIRVLIFLMSLMAISTLGIAFSRGESVLLLFSALFGFGYGAIWSLYAASASDYISKDYSGSVIGIWTIYLGIGGILGPVISGWIIDRMGSYVWAFLFASFSSIVSILFLVLVKISITGDLPPRRNELDLVN